MMAGLFWCDVSDPWKLPDYAQEALGVPKHIVYESCSDKVGDALGPDVMKSVKHLIPDILAALPMLLYQGKILQMQISRPMLSGV